MKIAVSMPYPGAGIKKMGYYRFINNEEVKEEWLIKSLQESSLNFVGKGNHYLGIQDTSAISYRYHKGRIKQGSLGWIANGEKDLGFFLHPTLLVNADCEQEQGFGHIELWSRDKEALHRDQRAYKKQAVEDKESWRWIKSMRQSRALMPEQTRMTFIQDREGDIYELFQEADALTHLVVRSRDNRCIEGHQQKLFEYLYDLPLAGHFDLSVRGDIRLNRTTRQAQLEIRYAPVQLRVPSRLKGAAPVKVWAVLAKEAEHSVPLGEEPLYWYLLTTHPVTSLAPAVQIVHWYSLRWYIETLFRILKSQGLGLEQCQLEHGAALRRLTLLCLPAALQIMHLWLAQKQPQQSDATLCFDAQQLQCLEQINQQVQGKTKKLSNPHPLQTMQWAAWIFARLGGWTGYASQRPPGGITLIRGYRRFENLWQGWILHDVYKP